MLTERSNGLPPKHLHNHGVDVRQFLAVGKVRQPVSAYNLVDLRLCFGLHRGVVQHCVEEYGDHALGLTRKVERKSVIIEDEWTHSVGASLKVVCSKCVLDVTCN